MSDPGPPPSAEVTAAMLAANAHGAALRCGDYLDIEQGVYGHIAPCPFCKRSQDEYPAMWYNGPGPPPSYAVQCGDCGAQGPTSRGTCRGDHYGARVDAVREWNRAAEPRNEAAAPASLGPGTNHND